MINDPGTKPAADPADPPEDRGMEHDGKPVPPGIANALVLVRILIAYGRHLVSILPVATIWPAYATVARFFQKAGPAETHARIHRGILRALALERVLLARAQRGRDLLIRRRQTRERAARPPQPRRYRPDDRWGVWLDRLPTLAEMEQQVRRRPVGSTIGDICLDLGVSHKLCAPWFWTALFNLMNDYRGNIKDVCLTLHKREEKFTREQCSHHEPPEATRDGVSRVVRFFIGEKPVDPCPPPAPIYPVLAPGAGPPRLLGWT